MIRVVNIRHINNSRATSVYVGRTNKTYGVSESPLYNPFKLKPDANGEDRYACINGYRGYIMGAIESQLRGAPYGQSAINELKRLVDIASKEDLQLVCWCSPEPCHGDTIKELIEGYLTNGKFPTLNPINPPS